jgi:RNA polymerase sigma-70 factor, ECF subfamily
MTADWAGAPVPGQDRYPDIESLIRDIHGELGRVAFRVLGHRADAEDAVQNGCIAMMRCWPKVAHLETARQQRAYLVRTVTNEALKILLRDKYRNHELLAVEGPEHGETEPGWLPEFPGGPGYAAREHLRYVWQAITGLPDGNREVVALYAAGYEYPEISEMLQVAVSTVRTHVSSARVRLRRAVSDEGRRD